MFALALLLAFTPIVKHAAGLTFPGLHPRQTDYTAFANDLFSVLSPKASIVFSNESTEWTQVTERWSAYHSPVASIVVEVATEADIQEVVMHARRYSIPFLARNRGHGTTSTLHNFTGGVQINLGALNNISIDTTQNIATLGGGTFNYDIIQTFYEAGKQSATGACDCVGLMGAALGGGHGRLQGMHGLMADNILSARVVLANGTLVTASTSSHPDLFWALRGAGHNFGIVTEIAYKVYDLVSDGQWWLAHYLFPGDALESIIETVNWISENQPAELSLYFMFMYESSTDSEPSILLAINSATPASANTTWTDKMAAIGPTWSNVSTVPLNHLASESFSGLDSELCTDGLYRNQWPVGLRVRNATTARQAFDLFASMKNEEPDLWQSQLIYENYALEALQSVPANSTAYPHRSTNVISQFTAVYNNDTMDATAIAWGKRFREVLQSGSGFDTPQIYVNYAQGDEDLQAVYGDDTWRLEKLRALKQTYDPEGAFDFYEPFRD